MVETRIQEVQRLQQEITQRQRRVFELNVQPPSPAYGGYDRVVGPYCPVPRCSDGTSSERMRRYMRDVSDKQQQQFPEPARPRLPEPGDD